MPAVRRAGCLRPAWHNLLTLLSVSTITLQVFQGVILAQRDRFAKPGAAGAPAARQPYGGSVTTPEGYLLGLWAHECARVFADKLVTQEDKAWVEAAVLELAKQVRSERGGSGLARQACSLLMGLKRCCLLLIVVRCLPCPPVCLPSRLLPDLWACGCTAPGSSAAVCRLPA